MARDIKDIYDQMAAEKAAQSQLNGLLVNPNNENSTLDTSQQLLNQLTTQSKVAVWRLMLWVMAFGIWLHEQLWDEFEADVNQLISTAVPGTPRWYQREALKFQIGYELVWDGSKYVYATLDESSRIISRCAIQDNGGIIRVKVAKGSTPGQLDAAEELAFNAYMQQIKFAGSNVLVVNFPADQIRFQIDIFYNAQIPLATVKAACEAAITQYLANLEFNGKFIVAHLTDRLQQVPGVVIPDVNAIDYLSASSPWAAINNEYQTVAGYAIVSPAFGFNANYVNGQPTLKFIPYE